MLKLSRRIARTAPRAPALLALIAMAGGATSASVAQAADAHTIPRGLLRIGFEPHYTNYDRRFAFGSSLVVDGALEFIGADLTADTVGTNLFPSLAPAEQAIRDITGNQSYRLNIGGFNTIRDADIRRFPFTLALGLTDRITLTANLPIVTHRSQITFTTDTTGANAGFNQALQTVSASGNPALIASLLAEMMVAVADVRASIAGGSFGCPGTAQCARAIAAADRGEALLANLMLMSGAGNDPNLASFAPIGASTEGQAITGEINAVSAELAALGATPITSAFPFPTAPVTAEDINGSLFADSSLGYRAAPLDFIRGTGFGDIELGLRIGIIQAPRLRVVVRTEVRLPTASLDSPDNFIDFGTGDRQLDFEAGIEAALLPTSPLSLNLAGSYTYQGSHTLDRRVGPPSVPIRLASALQTVTRNPGAILRITAYPTLRLAPGFRVFGLVNYYTKAADQYAGPASTGLFAVSSLGEESRMEALSFGGGIAYRSDFVPGQANPIEAGLNYQSAFSGSGGMTPKANQLRLYLRLYRNIFGEAPPSPEPASEIP